MNFTNMGTSILDRAHHSYKPRGKCYGWRIVMPWRMSCWKPGINADITYLNIVADHVQPFMAMVVPDVTSLLQQDNAPSYTAWIVQEWFEEHDNEFTVSGFLNSPDLWDVLDKSNPWRSHLTTCRTCLGARYHRICSEVSWSHALTH